MNSHTVNFPVPICAVCESPASYGVGGKVLVDADLGPVCADCAHDLARAVVGLVKHADTFRCLTTPKNNHASK